MDTSDLKVYRDDYLQMGSLGLKEFAQLKIGNVNNLAQRIWKHSRCYASLRSSTRAIHSHEGQLRETSGKLKKINAEALFPNMCFLIESMNSGGSTTEDGIIVGAELFSKTASSPLDELNPREKSVVEPVEKILQVVAKGEPTERPADLGYYVRYRICQTYYEKAADKKKVVKDTLQIRDFDQLFKESGYGLRSSQRGDFCPRDKKQPALAKH